MTFQRNLYSIYRTIKQRRFRKKLHIYKQVYAMSFDKTILIYLLVFLGYIGTAAFISGNFTNPVRNGFAFIEELGTTNFLAITSIYPIRYIFQSMRKPGITISSSEYQLTILPFRLREIWNVIVVEKWIKRIAVGLVFFLILLFTPLPNTLTATYIFTILLIDIAMTAPLWRLYQRHSLMKLLTFIGGLVVVGLLLYIHPILASVVVVLGIFMWNISAWKNLLRDVGWAKVVEGSDYKVWKMPLISSITKVPFKREKRVYVLQKIPFRRKKFVDDASAIHHRLWHSYMIKNIRVLFKMIGILLVFLSAMIFVNSFIFYVSIAISVHIFTKMSASLFYDRFKSDILEVLPWNLRMFRQTFLRWNVYGGIFLIVPVLIYYGLHVTWWVPIQIVFIISVSVYALHNELERASVLLARDKKEFFIEDALVLIGLVAIVFSGTYPMVSLLSIGYFILNRKRPR